MSFQEKLENIIQEKNTLLCIGLDSDIDKIPLILGRMEFPIFQFNKAIIDHTNDLVCAYKINSAFYEAAGDSGIKQLQMTCDYLREKFPTIPVILDAKRGDIGSSNEQYIKFAYDYLKVDAMTLNPYLGSDGLRPFLDIGDKGCIFLCKTSNPGAGEIQDLMIGVETLYCVVARKVATEWNHFGNCFLVVGATYPQELAEIRRIVEDMTILVPGIGAQGGDLEKMIRAGLNSKSRGLIINSGRNIIYAAEGEDFAQKAREVAEILKNDINKYREISAARMQLR